MRTLMRAGAIALAASSLLLTGGVAAQAAPTAAGVTFTLNRLILSPADHGYAGALRVTITNNTDQPYDDGITVVEPLARTVRDVGNGVCGINTLPDRRYEVGCGLDRAIPPGATRRVTITFESPAAPKPFARQSATSGSVSIAGVTTEFTALFRSSTGSVSKPVAYTPAAAQSLTIAAPDAVTLTRQDDGTYSATVPVTVTNHNDAPHGGWGSSLAEPAGLSGFPYATDGAPIDT
ncbi:hypothetical protein [Actinoplanes sp. NPDC089786]|uniref:hypothetical protein n=1 Tax=Actinoplanes sp. NPDC089786 TaxID=3155185 RepID=UPI0034433FBC